MSLMYLSLMLLSRTFLSRMSPFWMSLRMERISTPLRFPRRIGNPVSSTLVAKVVKKVVKDRKPRSQEKKAQRSRKKTYVSWSWEEETEAELLARKFDEQLYGRRAAKKEANHEDLRPVGRRPRDNKEKGDFQVDRRLKASRQREIIESRTA
jgi:hypothetical protein